MVSREVLSLEEHIRSASQQAQLGSSRPSRPDRGAELSEVEEEDAASRTHTASPEIEQSGLGIARPGQSSKEVLSEEQEGVTLTPSDSGFNSLHGSSEHAGWVTNGLSPMASRTPSGARRTSSAYSVPRWNNSPHSGPPSTACSPRSDEDLPKSLRWSTAYGSVASSKSGVRHRSAPSKSGGDTALYILPASESFWTDCKMEAEPDDILHDPRLDPIGVDGSGVVSTRRALLNLGTLAILGMGLLLLFAGYPIIAYFTGDHESTKGAFNLGGTNSSGQVSSLAKDFPGWKTGSTGLIDPDTPKDAYTRKGLDGATDFDLVFSDEFEVEGRSFYPGDDPFWEAVDLHYWATNNYEWYDPAAVTTRNGALEITLDQYVEHNLNFRGGMLQSWNKFCFTGGYVVASVRLPGSADVAGLWPAMWTMGNLGRAGYGATLEGTWPYTYDACDVGTLQNQTTVDGQPAMAVTGGDVLFNRKHNSNALSFLSGQKLSACTCPEDDHPGPKNKDGSWVGRSAPEIDVFEAQSTGKKMTLSQSAQVAPFNYKYKPYNTTEPAYTIYDPARTIENTYTGELMQQAMSAVTDAKQGAMQRGGDESFSEYGFEYQPGHGGYIEWVSDGQPAWRVNAAAMSGDPRVGIADRPIPNEPMYILFNVGVSKNFGAVDWENLEWPNTMAVEWVRVYQPRGQINVGCSPDSMPTADYINRHLEAYTNPNLTLWGNTPEEGGYGAKWPRNRLNPNACNAESSIFPGSPTDPKPKAPHLREDQIAEGETF